MQKLNRRDFIKWVGLGSLASVAPATLGAATPANKHVIVVGGGFSGATCAKYLKLWGGRSVDVTLIEPNPNYISPILSNLVLNGQKSLGELTFDYSKHRQNYEVNVITQRVTTIDKTGKSVTLSNGEKLSYDKLVLAPGIDFIQANAYDFEKVPHAWIAGTQTELLKRQIDAMQDGDKFVMSIPPLPFRCPPGPYERACVVADYLKNAKGLRNCQVVVLDANEKIIVEEHTFSSAFARYGIEYHSGVEITRIDDTQKRVEYLDKQGNAKSLAADVLNVIPKQKAGKVIFDAGLNEGNWAPVNPLSYESTKANDIYIIGDSQGTGQPKAGHIGNSEAKICADAILRSLNGHPLYPSPKTNSACYSPISRTEASWLSGVFEYDSTTKTMKLKYTDSGAPSERNYYDMFQWTGNLFADTFK